MPELHPIIRTTGIANDEETSQYPFREVKEKRWGASRGHSVRTLSSKLLWRSCMRIRPWQKLPGPMTYCRLYIAQIRPEILESEATSASGSWKLGFNARRVEKSSTISTTAIAGITGSLNFTGRSSWHLVSDVAGLGRCRQYLARKGSARKSTLCPNRECSPHRGERMDSAKTSFLIREFGICGHFPKPRVLASSTSSNGKWRETL